MLWTVKKRFMDGKITDEIVYNNEPLTIKPKKEGIVSCIASRFLYEIENSIAPTLYVSHLDGKKYIIPMWIEVHPETTYDDVVHTRPKMKKEIEKRETK